MFELPLFLSLSFSFSYILLFVRSFEFNHNLLDNLFIFIYYWKVFFFISKILYTILWVFEFSIKYSKEREKVSERSIEQFEPPTKSKVMPDLSCNPAFSFFSQICCEPVTSILSLVGFHSRWNSLFNFSKEQKFFSSFCIRRHCLTFSISFFEASTLAFEPFSIVS